MPATRAATGAGAPASAAHAVRAPAPPCSAPYRIDKTLPNGARWQLCWEMRNIEGLALTKVVYTPKGNRAVTVLRSTALAQIHVPYDNGRPRYHDIGALGFTAIALQSADCPGGERREQFVCVTTRARGHAYLKSDYDGPNTSAQGHDLVVFSAFQVGWYTYLVEWAFSDDGSITPRVGATGSLSGFTTTPEHGWPIGVGCEDLRDEPQPQHLLAPRLRRRGQGRRPRRTVRLLRIRYGQAEARTHRVRQGDQGRQRADALVARG